MSDYPYMNKDEKDDRFRENYLRDLQKKKSPHMNTQNNELRTKIEKLSVYKAAINMHTQYRSDINNLERFSTSWATGVETLINSEVLAVLSRLETERMYSDDGGFIEGVPTEAIEAEKSKYE